MIERKKIEDNLCNENALILHSKEKQKFRQAKFWCTGFGGTMPRPKNMEEQNQFYEAVNGSSLYWLSWNDIGDEGNFESSIGKKVFLNDQPFSNWAKGEPNGRMVENCVTSTDDNRWNDNNCNAEFVNAVCKVQSTPFFTLRGKYE